MRPIARRLLFIDLHLGAWNGMFDGQIIQQVASV